MGQYYIFIRDLYQKYYGWYFAFLLAMIGNVIEDDNYYSLQDFFRIMQEKTFTFSLAMIATIIFLIAGLALIIMRFIMDKTDNDAIFSDLIKQHDSVPCVGSSLSWGENKVFAKCDNLLDGWRPEDICIQDYDNGDYILKTFDLFKNSPYTEENYQEYYADHFCTKDQLARNQPRYMISYVSVVKNRLFLKLQRTEWSQTSFLWKCVQDNKAFKEYVAQAAFNHDEFRANSFCMHLIIESYDKKVMLARISKHKFNDSPGTIAATIGEQIELEDFSGKHDLQSDFLLRWLKRAFIEEFCLTEEKYRELVSPKSLRVLSLDYETDIYNFALVCVVRLNYNAEKCKRFLDVNPMDDKEVSAVDFIGLEEIPHILLDGHGYHPSTQLRLLLYLIHRKGYSKAKSMILAEKSNSACVFETR